MEPPWDGGTKVYINGPGHTTRMAAMPIYGKMIFGMDHYVLKLYKVYINDDPELTLTYFETMSNLAKLAFVLK